MPSSKQQYSKSKSIKDEYDEMSNRHFIKASRAIDNRKRNQRIDSMLKTKNPKQFLDAIEEELQ